MMLPGSTILVWAVSGPKQMRIRSVVTGGGTQVPMASQPRKLAAIVNGTVAQTLPQPIGLMMQDFSVSGTLTTNQLVAQHGSTTQVSVHHKELLPQLKLAVTAPVMITLLAEALGSMIPV
jgi:hypothetical protein